MQQSIALIILLLTSLSLKSQITATYTDANRHYKQAELLFSEQLYGLAKNEFEKASKISTSLFDERSQLLASKAKLYIAKSAYLGKFPEGEKMLLDYYYHHIPDAFAYDAALTLGNLKYNQKRYEEAIDFYSLIDLKKLSTIDRDELHFRKGYSHFLLKDFDLAEANFNPIIGKDTPYYYQTYYYSAMIKFFEQDYEKAIEYFFILENFPDYKTRIPYYIAQIYFEQKKYDDILVYIPSQLQNPGVENIKELRHILGQTYFLKGDYEAALPHLEYYESQSRKMRKEDFYQLAFAQYQMGQYEKAARNFKELSSQEGEMGQISNNYLGDAYLKLGQKEDARVSFKNVTNFPFNLDLKNEATFNYGKLSAELGYDRAAITSLMELPPSASQYAKAQSVLGDLFESSKDYAMVIQTIEGIDNKAPEILKAYQKVVLEKGIQLINDGEKTLALQTLLKAAKTPVDNYYTAVIYYHIADLQHQMGNYDSSINYLNQYFTLSNLTGQLPESARPVMANYLQGYNHLKLRDFTNAIDRFSQSKTQMAAMNFESSANKRYQRMYADVLNRIGDAYFTVNKYQKAAGSYEMASKLSFPGQDYAIFQWAMIKGLQGKPYEKIVLMEQLLQSIPTSSFRDDAYFQIGETQLALNQARKAELAYENILNYKGRSPLVTRALLKLGLIAYNKGETEKAIKYYTELFENNPSKNEAQEALVALEEIYIQDLGRAEDFADVVEKATGYKMSSLERDSLSYIAAEGKFENGEYIEAIDSYTKYINNFPRGINRLQAIFNRAESKVILKRYSEAVPDYSLVIEAGQSEYYEDAVRKAALISYNDLQKFEEAFNFYSLLDEITSDELLQYEAQLGAMRSASRFGNTNATMAYTAKVIINPLASKEDKAFANFLAGKINYDLENWEAAKAQLEQVFSLTDNETAAEAKYLRNNILFKNGNAEQAEELTLESVSNSTAYPYWVAKNLLLLGDIMISQNDLFNAKAAVEAVIENFKESEELQKEAKEKLALILEKEAMENRIDENTTTINLDTINRNE